MKIIDIVNYESRLKSSNDDIISAADDFFTIGIKALKHQ